MASTPTAEAVWQDREIRFDCSDDALRLRPGEFEIDTITTIEDTKGNNGEKGALFLTNLRMIWIAHKSKTLNLSIGLDCIVSISIHPANSRLGGHTEALFCLTKWNNNRYEFIFTNILKGTPRLFTSIQAVHCSYESSRLYRDLRLRGAIIANHELILLPKESIYRRVSGVWNLSSDQGNLGTFIITNIRLVWFANMAENFNVSLPYIQMRSIRVRTSKFGPALVLSTSAQSGNFTLGFRIDPEDMLDELHRELISLREVYTKDPEFGVEFAKEERPKTLEERKVANIEDDVEIVEDYSSMTMPSQYLEANKEGDRPPVFSKELGLAVEEPPNGATLSSLWQVFT